MSSDSTRQEIAIFVLREYSFEMTAFDSIIIHKNFDPKFTSSYSGCIV